MATHDIFVDGLSLCRTHNRSPWECLQSAESRLAIAVRYLKHISDNQEDGYTFSGTDCKAIADEALAQMGEK